jgi:N-acetylglucosamine-6-phosphate deacetylase
MRSFFHNGRILTRHGLQQDHALLVEDGVIVAVDRAENLERPSSDRVIDLAGQMLLPGFIDLQVNGGGGVLFNEQPSVEAIAAIGSAHRRFGTTGFLPTLITDDLSAIETAMQSAALAVESVPGVLGIHVEGPFLNQERKGVHDSSKFRLLDEPAFRLLTGMTAGKCLVTLAPELTSPAMIQRLVAGGVIVAAGHTNGSYEQISAALAEGMQGFTHLFNAMSPLVNRAPGAVGAALDHDASHCGIIVDGHHVHPAALRIALKAKGADRLMLVTDAMPSVGTEDKSFLLQGRKISVSNGICVDENGVLAGSDLDMASAVRNASRLMGVDLPTAVAMASRVPAEFLGLGDHLGHIAPGYQADLVLVDDDLAVHSTWIKGID